MKRLNIFLAAFVVALLALSACMEEKMDAGNATVVVELRGLADLPADLSGVSVTLQNTQLPVSYTALTDASGLARFDVEYGFYRANAQYKYTSSTRNLTINAASESFVVADAAEHRVVMESAYPSSAQLIFKEIYYTGCVGKDGKSYGVDQYLKIYNNSPEVAYLDSICIGFLDPMNASPSPKGWEGLDYLPVMNFMWMFPGSGTDNPLAPGEEVVIAVNGINHVALGNTNSVDLSREGYWAMYDEKANLTKQSVPAPGVKCMQNIWKWQGTSCQFSMFSPAWIMWKIEGSMEEFFNTSLRPHPTQTGSLRYMCVPVEWVYDGVECFISAGYVKRLPSSIDNGYTSIPESSASGYSVHRVVDESLTTPERTVYLDTNDSSKDFVKQRPSLKE